jgi:phosphate transport system substrate-binding protein
MLLAAVAMAVAIAMAPHPAAAEDNDLAAYQPDTAVSGELRIWGPRAMTNVVTAWAAGFKRFHPTVRVTTRLTGSDTATPGLYAGQADIALLGRDINITDVNGFGRVKQYAPQRVELMGGSLATPGQSSALAVFVHRRNPLATLAVTQLAALLACEPADGVEPTRRWGQLGLTGPWAERPIRIYSFDVETGTGLFLLGTVLAGNRRLHWEAITEYRDRRRRDGSLMTSAAQQILRALSRDPDGLAIAHAGFRMPDVKMLAVASTTAGPFVELTAEHLISGAYPLGRRTYAFVDRPPNGELPPRVREFLRYALSREGQQAVARLAGYLPLSVEHARAQLALVP